MLTFIPTPLGNLQDITWRAVETIKQCTLFLCEDTRVTRRLFSLLHERGILPDLPEGEFLSFNEHNGAKRLQEIGRRLAQEEVAYLSDAGMPAISDPGQLLVAYCQEKGLDYDVLPGPSAVTTAYAASGFGSGHFLFYGFLPHKGRARREALDRLLAQPWETVLYEAPHRLEKLLEEIVSREPEREVFAAKELSKQHQRYYRERAAVLLERLREEKAFRGEWVVILGAGAGEGSGLSVEDVLAEELPPKAKAKLLARLTGESVKSCYERLIEQS
ncbi:16S rRNA (cytidine(1402)-2'-O)-methyltransferase [Nitratifractor sp.]